MGSLVSFNKACESLFDLKTSSNAKVFIETGCFRGKSLEFALQTGFDFCYSCDVDQEMIDHCKDTLNYNNFEIHLADSVSFLDSLLPRLSDQDSIIFFLDAHLPGHDKKAQYSDIVLTEQTFPLERELDVIFKHRQNKTDVIICDDLRIYEDGPFTGGVWHDRHQFNLNLDFIEKYPATYKKYYADEGYIVLTGTES